MRPRIILHILGLVIMLLSGAMLAPLLISLLYNDGDTASFVLSFATTASCGTALFFLFRPGEVEITRREGFVIVSASWVGAGLFSSLPFLLSGSLPLFVDAFYEATSGLTTTGASVITDIEALPHGIVFWRSLTHWFGGMGIVLMGVAVLPLFGIGGMQLYKSEASTIGGDKFVPRIREMARILFTIYIVLSFGVMVLLLLSGMGLFDAFIHAVGSIATGGFSNKNISVEFFHSPLIEAVMILAMVIGGMNFSLHYEFYRSGVRAYLKNEEFRFYILAPVAATVLVAINLRASYYTGIAESIRHAAFQVSSIMTTTGYSSADFGRWPYFSQFILFILMFIGGSAGSTAGAIKCVRILVLFKLIYKEIYGLIHPHAVLPVKFGGKVIPPEVLKGVAGFTFLYIIVFVVSSLLLALSGLDIVTSISSVATNMGNVGPGLGLTGPASNFSVVSSFAKWVLIADMFIGRLEIYTLLILFVPAFWKK